MSLGLCYKGNTALNAIRVAHGAGRKVATGLYCVVLPTPDHSNTAYVLVSFHIDCDGMNPDFDFRIVLDSFHVPPRSWHII